MKITLRKNSKLFPNLCLTTYFTYMLDPFFLNSIVGINRIVYYAVAFLPITYSLFYRSKLSLDRTEKKILMCILLIVVWAFIMSGAVAGDLFFFSDMEKLLFKVIAGIGLFIVWRSCFNKKIITWNYEKVFTYAISIYIFSSLVFLIIPSLRVFWESLIYNDRQPQYILEMASYATRYGLAGWSSFGEAYMVLFGEIAVIIMHQKKELSKIQFIILNMIMMIGIFLYGRFALIIGVIILSIWGIYTLLIKKELWIINVILISFVIGTFIIISLYNNDSTKAIIEWAMEPILYYMNTGSFLVNSTAQLNDMYREFNPSMVEFFTGVGKWYESSGLPYKKTDVGFMRNIYFGGIGFCFLLYGTDVLISHKFAYSIRSIKSFKKLIFIVLILVLITADLKGSMTFNFMRYTIPFIMANKYYLRKENGR